MGNTQSNKSNSQLLKLPLPMYVEIFSYLGLNELRPVSTTCKTLNLTLNSKYLWTLIYARFSLPLGEPPYNSKLSELLKTIWSTKYKSDAICLSDDLKVATRGNCERAPVCNPAVLAKQPISKHTSFSFKVRSIGSWMSVGLATKKFNLDKDSVVGAQTGKELNIGFYSHGNTCDIRCNGGIVTKCDERFKEDDIIQFIIESGTVKMHYENKYYSGFVGAVDIISYSSSILYPCASLSFGSSVELLYE